MLFLHFQIGEESYALDADRIVEILPLVELNAIRHAPEGIAGSFDYRGRFISVVDLCALELGRPARPRLSTRIIVTRLAEGDDAPVGLIAENATDTLRCDPSDFAPFAPGPRGLVQRLDLATLIPPRLRAFLHGEPVDSQ
jgi:chemotaxis-related protein WspB